MVEVKSERITRLKVMIVHAKELQTFLKQYNKKFSCPVGWEGSLVSFLRHSNNNLDWAILEAYKKEDKVVRTSNQRAKSEVSE